MSEGAQRAIELRLREALQRTPGLTIVELARVVGGCRSVTGDRLRQLARDGKFEKGPGGHWRWREKPHVDAEPQAVEPEPERPRPAPGAPPPWIRPISDYERRETSEVHGTRYG